MGCIFCMFACMEDAHERYMSRCLELASNGLGTTYPNPLVGCVIVHKGHIIGEGWHRKSGEEHAENSAIKSVSNQGVLKDATLYVNLEPCCHYGNTPPCTKLIIEKGIKRVVIGSLDPNTLVSGKGVEEIKSQHVEVTIGILQKECLEINRRFFTFHNHKRPYIILKWAESIDGFIDAFRGNLNKKYINWISNVYSRQLTHRWRTEEDAILVGTTTAMNDNPSLDSRDWFGNQPTRVVIDRTGKLDPSSKLLNASLRTLVFTEQDRTSTKNIVFISTDFEKQIIPHILETLHKKLIQSVIIEGGSFTLQSFLKSSLWDEIRVFSSTHNIKNGLRAPRIKRPPKNITYIGSDKLSIYRNENAKILHP